MRACAAHQERQEGHCFRYGSPIRETRTRPAKTRTGLRVQALIFCTVPNDGCLNFVDENDEVLLAGFGRKGKAKGDIPGVRFKGQFTQIPRQIAAALTPHQSSRFRASVSLLCGRRRRRSRGLKCGAHGKRQRFGMRSLRGPFTLAFDLQVGASGHLR